MTLRPQTLISVLIMTMLVLGGYAILSASPALQGPVVPTRRPISTVITDTPTTAATDAPTAPPTETAIPTPSTPVAQAVRSLPVRGGPSSQYPVVATLAASEELAIIGISEDGAWYQVLLPDGSPAWLSSSSAMVTTFGNALDVPLAEPPTSTPTDTATPTPTDTPSSTSTPTDVATSTPVATATPQQGGPIELGSTVQGIIQGQISEARYTFSGEAGEIVDIRMNNVSGNLDPLVILLGPDGAEIVRNDDDPGGLNRDSFIQGFTLPASGEYTIVATRFQQAQGVSEGNYSLTLSPGTTAPPSPTPGQGQSETVEGTIQGAITEVRYTFTGQAGDVIDIQMVKTSGTLDPLLVLYGVNGLEIARDDDSGGELNAHISAVTLTTSGTYTISATRFALISSEGTFALTFTLVSGSGPVPVLVPLPGTPQPTQTNAVICCGNGDTIAYGQTIQGTLGGAVTEVRYTFTGQAGDIVDIRMNKSAPQLDPILILLGPNGLEIVRDDDGGGSRNSYIRSFTLPSSGTYTIVATSYQNSAGDFTVTLTSSNAGGPISPTVPPVNTGNTITFGQTVQGTVPAQANGEVRYTFTAQAGDVIEIHMNRAAGSSLDPLLILLGPNGQEVSRDDDGGGSRNAYIRTFTIATSGTYTIVATQFGTAGGNFSLSLTR